jgi:uncharacterized protein YceH (UPF0502 family)
MMPNRATTPSIQRTIILLQSIDAMNDSQPSSAAAAPESAQPRWRPLERIDRRVVGVLVEKAKTTPEQYPLTINSLINGCNQKNNRDPQMELEEADVIESLDRLKAVGAVTEIQGSGRVAKFRHLLYEWMGVDKVELAVMGELLLRGAQTEGELRGRASRMEPIADLNALRSILQSLRSKRLVTDVTPPGRGQIISHTLYQPEEMERLKQKFSVRESEGAAAPAEAVRSRPSAPATSQAASGNSGEIQSLRAELAELRQELESLAETVRQQEKAISDLSSAIGG